MPDLFAERVKAFAQLRNSLATIGEPQGLEAYRERLKIQAEVNKEALLDAESMMARIKMQGLLAEQKYAQMLGYEAAKMDVMQDAEDERQAKELASPEMQTQAALAIGELDRFEDSAGVFGLRDIKPGQQLRFLGFGKKFKPENIFEIASPQIRELMGKTDQLKKIKKQGLNTDGMLKSSLIELVNELNMDLNSDYVKEQMQNKGTEQQQSLYAQYLKIINEASSFLNQ